MNTLIALIVILGYLTSPIIGFVLTCGIAWKLYHRNATRPLQWQIQLLLLTMPLYMTPILPGLPAVASWTTLLLLIVSITLLRGGSLPKPLVAYAAGLFAYISIIGAIIQTGGIEGLYYTFQIILFVAPIFIAHQNRRIIPEIVEPNFSVKLYKMLAGVIAGTSLAVIVQWFLHVQAGTIIGNVSVFNSRTVYDLTIPAFSVLSAILAIGIALGPTLWRNGSPLAGVLLPILASTAILINSSRTGLFAGVFALVLSVLFPPKGASRFAARLGIIPVIGAFVILYQVVMSLPRFQDGMELTDDNGRFQYLLEAWHVYVEDPINWIIGVGYGADSGPSAHNSIVETLTRSGFVATFVLILGLVFLLQYLRGTEFLYPVVTLFAGSMAFSGFYAVKAFTVVALVSVVCLAAESVNSKNTTGNPKSISYV